MKLQVPFIQLPVRFDAARMANEIAHFAESDWLPHPLRFAGNSALPLVAVNGDARNDDFAGPMLPTAHLQRSPYLQQVLGSLGAVWGRVRLMRLSGNAEVEPHVDINYYWHERVRVHIPILTQPSVRFHCDDAEVNMAAGECWIFDTWRRHRVVNANEAERIHLVADTVGSETFWNVANAGYAPPVGTGHGRPVPLLDAEAMAGRSQLLYEAVNMPPVMTPWEMRQHLTFLFSEAVAHPNLAKAQSVTMRFLGRWQALWARFGEAKTGWPEYRRVLDAYSADLAATAPGIMLVNGVNLLRSLMAMVVRNALADEAVALADQAMEDPLRPTDRPRSVARAVESRFARPVFIVSSPRSGSTLLFETLMQAPNVYTIGDESHALIESIPALHPAAADFASNRLDATAATPDVTLALRAAFFEDLRDRDGHVPAADTAARMLEKTPKNSLRIPFLAQVFPDSHFIFLQRDPSEVLASMIEAWNSGRFRTYPQLPGWEGPPWSLLLTPGWRELKGKPLHEIVARQWQTTMSILLTDLSALPRARVHTANHADLLRDPNSEIRRLCNEVGFHWNRQLDPVLPLSRYTISRPDPDKWRKHQAAIESVLPSLQATIERAAHWPEP